MSEIASDQGFDLDGYIGEISDHYAVKHGRKSDDGVARAERAFARAARDHQVRERSQRREAPKLAIREEARIWTPNG